MTKRAEVEFLIENDDGVVPVEVKASAGRRVHGACSFAPSADFTWGAGSAFSAVSA